MVIHTVYGLIYAQFDLPAGYVTLPVYVYVVTLHGCCLRCYTPIPLPRGCVAFTRCVCVCRTLRCCYTFGCSRTFDLRCGFARLRCRCLRYRCWCLCVCCVYTRGYAVYHTVPHTHTFGLVTAGCPGAYARAGYVYAYVYSYLRFWLHLCAVAVYTHPVPFAFAVITPVTFAVGYGYARYTLHAVWLPVTFGSRLVCGYLLIPTVGCVHGLQLVYGCWVTHVTRSAVGCGLIAAQFTLFGLRVCCTVTHVVAPLHVVGLHTFAVTHARARLYTVTVHTHGLRFRLPDHAVHVTVVGYAVGLRVLRLLVRYG